MSRRYRFPLVLAFLLTALFIFVMVSGAAPAQLFEYKQAGQSGDNFVQDEILVKFKPAVKYEEIEKVNRGLGIAEAHRTYSGVFRLKVPENRLGEMVEIYSRLPMVEYAEPNYVYIANAVSPNDPLYNLQWHMGSIQAEQAWSIQTGSPDVVVAVVDTGVAYENYGKYVKAPDLAGTKFVAGYDFVNNDSHPNDDNSHGTHVAGTIAQSTNNGTGVAGVAFNTAIMPVKVLDKSGRGSSDVIASAVKWAADNGADVINLSLGGGSYSNTFKDALGYAYGKGVTIIASAGNDGAGTVSYPAAYDDFVIAVGATRYDNTLSYYSNYGSALDLVAPGGDTNVDQNGDGYGDGILQNTFNPTTKNTSDFGYWFFQGTSMAAPHVSGVAALLISNGVTGPDEVRNVLQSTAKDLGTAGRDDYYGYGLVDAYAALTYAQPPANNAPVANNDSYSINEDTALNVASTGVLANDTDADGDTLSAVLVSGPGHGSLTLNSNGSFSYTPVVNYSGTDSFTYRAHDGKAYSDPADVSITVNAVNDAPVAEGDSYATDVDTPLSVGVPGVLGNDTDVDGDVLSAVLVSGPGHGTLWFNANGSFTYTPAAGYNGYDSFSYKANDGKLDSNTVTVAITVNAVDEPPADTTAPTWPSGSYISALSITKNSVTLTWTAAADDVGIASYKIYQSGYASKVYSVSGSTLQYKVTGLKSKKTYTFDIEAFDAAGNRAPGPSVTITTP